MNKIFRLKQVLDFAKAKHFLTRYDILFDLFVVSIKDDKQLKIVLAL